MGKAALKIPAAKPRACQAEAAEEGVGGKETLQLWTRRLRGEGAGEDGGRAHGHACAHACACTERLAAGKRHPSPQPCLSFPSHSSPDGLTPAWHSPIPTAWPHPSSGHLRPLHGAPHGCWATPALLLLSEPLQGVPFTPGPHGPQRQVHAPFTNAWERDPAGSCSHWAPERGVSQPHSHIPAPATLLQARLCTQVCRGEPRAPPRGPLTSAGPAAASRSL